MIVGQQHLVNRLLVGLVGNGHLLLEGVPGLAKTLSLKTLAAAAQVKFRRAYSSRPTCCPRTLWAR